MIINTRLPTRSDSSRAWSLFSMWAHHFNTYTSPDKKAWAVFDRFQKPLEEMLVKKGREFFSLHKFWQARLKYYGGDPNTHDWNQFRPLRLSAEEDWSDWLAHLIFSSDTGYFAYKLLKIPGFNQLDYKSPPECKREVVSEGYRADIVIRWGNDSFTHLEVKIGDPNLAKTHGTAKRMQAKYPEYKSWSDYILLLESQRPAWDELAHDEKNGISVLTWKDVTLALRKSLVHSSENRSWEAWAYSFIGAIDQKLLFFPRTNPDILKIGNISKINAMIIIMKEGQENG